MRRKIFLAIILFSGLAIFISFISPFSKTIQKTANFRVVTANIGHLSDLPKPGIDQWVKILNVEQKPDIIFLQEVGSVENVIRLAFELGYEYWITDPARGNSADLAILSRWWLREPEYLAFNASQTRKGALCAKVGLGGCDFLVCSVHLDPINISPEIKDGQVDFPWIELIGQLFREVFTSTVRSRSTGELTAWLSIKNQKRIIIGGDFNTIPLSRSIWKICSKFDDVLWPSWDFFRGTYTLTDFPLKPRLDYIFHSENIHCPSSRILPRTAGDHLPIEAGLKTEDINQWTVEQNKEERSSQIRGRM